MKRVNIEVILTNDQFKKQFGDKSTEQIEIGFLADISGDVKRATLKISDFKKE